MGMFYNHSSKLFYRESNGARPVAGQKGVLHVDLRLFPALPRTPSAMIIDLETRRSIRKISRADFDAFPVWEWALNEEETAGLDESFLRPTTHDSIVPGMTAHFVVGARATLSDGTVLPACAQVDVRGKKVQVQPLCLFLQERQLDFAGDETNRVLSHLTRQPEARAVAWELVVPVAGRDKPLSGKLRLPLAARIAALFGRGGASASAKSLMPLS